LLLMPILSTILPVSQVPAALSIGTFASSASRIFAFYKNINWAIVKYFVPAALPAVWLGSWLLRYLNPVYLEVAMGLFLVSNLPYVLKKNKATESEGKLSKNLFLAIGFLAGFLSGLTGVVGLLFNKFYLRHGLAKEEIVATRAANEVLLHLIKIVLYTLFGLISSKGILLGLAVAASALLSTFTMKIILPRISELIFKKIGYSAMVLSGILMLSQSRQSILLSNKGTFSTKLISKGIETRLQWQNANYALEFAYDEGFEIELVIPFSSLTTAQQMLVIADKKDNYKIIVEAVYTIGEDYYEAYYFTENKLVNKIEFK
jgi:uncharacterized protein